MKTLIPAGSIVLLKNAVKRLMIIGVLQQKQSEQIAEGIPAVYDYIGVPYPEGYLGPDSAFLFNHEDIQEIVFTGFEDDERKGFLQILAAVYDSAEQAIEAHDPEKEGDASLL